MHRRNSALIQAALFTAIALATACTSRTPAAAGADVAAHTPGSEAQSPVVLTFSGLVATELALSMADLEAMGKSELTIEHPKEGRQTYSGVLLSALLDRAQPAPDGVLTFTAVDAYAVDVPVDDARACKECMVAYDGSTLRLVMPDMGSSFWVKDVVSIEAR